MLHTKNDQFFSETGPVLLQGAGLGNWLNLEHFLLGIPGTQTEIRAAIAHAYGVERAQEFWQTYYHRYVAEADITFLKSLGFNSVRLPFNVRAFFDRKNFEQTTGVRELDRVLALCAANQLYAVLDLHAAAAGQNPDWHSDNTDGDALFFKNADARTQAATLWGKLAEHYADHPWIGGYDLINEPCYFDPAGDSVLIRFYADCIEQIRKSDTRHIVILEGNTYARDFRMFQSNLDDNLAYTFHYYPFLQLPGQLQPEGLKERIRDSLYRDVTLEHLQKLGKPLWCGETGHPLHQEESIASLGVYLDLLEELSISWALWPHKDARAMALCFPPENADYLSLVREASGNWSFWDVFSQDSILSIEGSADKNAFYRARAKNSSDANARFQKALSQIPFETFLLAIEDFSFDSCEPNAPLLAILKGICP